MLFCEKFSLINSFFFQIKIMTFSLQTQPTIILFTMYKCLSSLKYRSRNAAISRVVSSIKTKRNLELSLCKQTQPTKYVRRSGTQISSRFKKKPTQEEIRVFRWKRVRENNWKSLVKLKTCYQFLGIRLKAF